MEGKSGEDLLEEARAKLETGSIVKTRAIQIHRSCEVGQQLDYSMQGMHQTVNYIAKANKMSPNEIGGLSLVDRDSNTIMNEAKQSGITRKVMGIGVGIIGLIMMYETPTPEAYANRIDNANPQQLSAIIQQAQNNIKTLRISGALSLVSSK